MWIVASIVLSQAKSRQLLPRRAAANAPNNFLDDDRRKSAPALIFVTHHIEESPSFVTHGLVLKKGRILAKGPVGEVCTSRTMSEALQCEAEVHFQCGRFRLEIRGKP